MTCTIRLLLAALAILVAAISAEADPVRVTNGTAHFQTGGGTDMYFELRAGAVRAEGNVYGDESHGSFVMFQRPHPLEAGVIVNASSQWIMSAAHSRDSPGLNFWTGEFTFRTEFESLSCQREEDRAFCFAQAPFAFVGRLAGFDSEGQQRRTHDFIGRGQASAYFEQGGPSAIGYQFDDTAAVPEPGTLILFATGAAAIGRRASKRLRG